MELGEGYACLRVKNFRATSVDDIGVCVRGGDRYQTSGLCLCPCLPLAARLSVCLTRKKGHTAREREREREREAGCQLHASPKHIPVAFPQGHPRERWRTSRRSKERERERRRRKRKSKKGGRALYFCKRKPALWYLA